MTPWPCPGVCQPRETPGPPPSSLCLPGFQAARPSALPRVACPRRCSPGLLGPSRWLSGPGEEGSPRGGLLSSRHLDPWTWACAEAHHSSRHPGSSHWNDRRRDHRPLPTQHRKDLKADDRRASEPASGGITENTRLTHTNSFFRHGPWQILHDLPCK